MKIFGSRKMYVYAWMLLLCSLISFGCSVKGGIKKKAEDLTVIDLNKSTVTVANDGVDADGEATAVVVVKLKNKKGEPLVGITPNPVVAGASSIICTPTDSSGVATCDVKSNTSGSISVQLTVAGRTMPAQPTITFKTPQVQTPGFSVSGGGTDTLSVAGMVGSGTLGEIVHHNIVITDGVSPGVDSIEGGIILTAQGGSQTMAHPVLPGPAVMYQPYAMANIQGLLYPTP